MNDDDRRFRIFIVAAVVVVALYLILRFVSDLVFYYTLSDAINRLKVL